MKILNKYTDKLTENSVYIGRGTKWGNPFRIGIDGTRTEVIEKYRIYLLNNPQLIKEAKEELSGKDLICFCSPKQCHGEVLRDYVEDKLYE